MLDYEISSYKRQWCGSSYALTPAAGAFLGGAAGTLGGGFSFTAAGAAVAAAPPPAPPVFPPDSSTLSAHSFICGIHNKQGSFSNTMEQHGRITTDISVFN